MKNEVLALNGRLIRSVAVNPKPILDSLIERKLGITQEISTIQSSIEIKGLSPLVVISQLAAATEATLINFTSSEEGKIIAIFSAETSAELNNLKAQLEKSNLLDIIIKTDIAKLQLTLTATGN